MNNFYASLSIKKGKNQFSLNPYKSLLNINKHINVDKKLSLSKKNFNRKTNGMKSYNSSKSKIKSSTKSIKKITVKKTSGKFKK